MLLINREGLLYVDSIKTADYTWGLRRLFVEP